VGRSSPTPPSSPTTAWEKADRWVLHSWFSLQFTVRVCTYRNVCTTHLLEVSYCLVVSSLLLYQLKVDVIQPVLFVLLIWTPLLKLHVCVSTCRYTCSHWWEMKGTENCFDSLQPNLPFPSPAWCRQESVPPVWERVPCSCLSSWPCWGRRGHQWTSLESGKLVILATISQHCRHEIIFMYPNLNPRPYYRRINGLATFMSSNVFCCCQKVGQQLHHNHIKAPQPLVCHLQACQCNSEQLL